MARPTKEPAGEGTVKASFNLPPSMIMKLKYIALMDKTTQTEILTTALTEVIAKWEKKNGTIPTK